MPTPFLKRLSDDATADFIDLVPRNPSLIKVVPEILPTIPNKDGHAVRLLAKQGQPYRWYGVRNFSSINNARVSVEALRENLVGKLFEANTRYAELFERLLCLAVDEMRPPQQVLALVGGLASSPGSLWGGQGSAGTTALAWISLTCVHVGPEA